MFPRIRTDNPEPNRNDRLDNKHKLTMFEDLDSTLSKVLNDAAMKSPPIVPPLTELFDADVSFITPDKNFGALDPKPAVNLFLYDVKENRDLRDSTPIIEKVGSGFVRRQPPVRIDCSYIVTAWSKKTNDSQVIEEHRLLAQALLWLTRFPTIPAQYLQGSLTTQPYPLMMWAAQIDPNKNAGEFWDALAIPPRAAFYLTVTIAMELGLADSGPLVTTRSTEITPQAATSFETLVQIGGRILGPEVSVARVERNLVNAAAATNQATLSNAGDAALFRRGDVVLLKELATEELATVQSVAGAILTLEQNLTNNFNGGTIRIADIAAGARAFRVDDTKGINPGTPILITQAADVEEHTVESVDRLRNVLTLNGALLRSHGMLATDPAIKVAGVVSNALIEITDAGLKTQSALDGRYTFPRVPVGTRNVQVLATGFQPKNQSVVVPGQPEDYEITLTPLP